MRSVLRTAAIFLTIPAMVLATPAVGKPERGMRVGDRLSARSLKTLDMQKVPLPAPEGLTVVVFWATWSPRSAPALELWQEYGSQYRDQNIQVVSVNADGQNMQAEEIDTVRTYVEEHRVTLPVHVDSDLELFNEIGIIVLPTILFLKNDGTIAYKYPGFPTSARLDLKEDLEKELGVWVEPSAEEQADRGRLHYQPRNNALLYYNLGKRLEEKGFVDKARPKYVEALQKDPEYADPLRALERIFFADGRTENAEIRLRELLVTAGLEQVVEHIGEDVYSNPEESPGAVSPAGSQAAPAATAEEKALTPMERMRLMMEKQGQ